MGPSCRITRVRPALPIFVAAMCGVLFVGACSTTQDEPPSIDASVPPPRTDGAVPVPSPDAAPPVCDIVDIPQGKGRLFCELPGADAPDVTVPPEFCVRELTTTPVLEARVMAFAPNGDLFLTAPSQSTVGGAHGGPGGIFVLPDDDGDGRADAVLPFAGTWPSDGRPCAALEADPKGLACVHGLLFSGSHVYYTRSDEIRRFPYRSGDRTATSDSELVAKLGGASIPDARFAHTLERTKDGLVYVSRGRGDSSACSDEEMSRGAVLAIDPRGALPLVPSIVADGFRNPMYLRCSPSSCGDCYASELSGDDWDGVGGREKLSLLGKIGETWGYPCCVGQGEPHPRFRAHDCANVGRELVSIPLHDTNFGLDFDRGGFPAPYRHGLFVALHGVFTSFGGTGVVFVPTDPISKRPTGPATAFARGFAPTGRATDAVFAPDGRLFVADDTAGKIYWIAPRTLRAAK